MIGASQVIREWWVLQEGPYEEVKFNLSMPRQEGRTFQANVLRGEELGMLEGQKEPQKWESSMRRSWEMDESQTVRDFGNEWERFVFYLNGSAEMCFSQRWRWPVSPRAGDWDGS